MRTFLKPDVPSGARTLEASWYVSDDVFHAERERIFARSWICIGRAAELADAGAFLVREIADESLIVTRDAAGGLRAFYNVCRHRGTRLCTQRQGNFKASIQCPYHAWTYALDGSLLAARNMHATQGFDRSQYPLNEAHVAEFEGFVFAALDPLRPFAATFAPLHSRFAPWQLGALRPAKRIVYEIACNWKLVFQNYSECYHCPVIHPQLERLSPSDSGRNDLTEGPFLGGYSELREQTESLTTTGHTTRPPLASVRGENRSRVYYYTIFPSLLLSLHPDYAMAHYVRPVSHARTEVACEWLFDARELEDPGFATADAIEFWDLTNRQDWAVSELTQLGVASRSYVPGPYSNDEGLLHAFDRHYLGLMR